MQACKSGFFVSSLYASMSVLAVGTVALDTIETPFAPPQHVLGGSATYVALAARQFVPGVQLVGVVGGDFPDAYAQRLRQSGIDLAGLEVDGAGETFAWAGRYHYDMNQRDTLETHLNVLTSFAPILPRASRAPRILCLGNLDPAIQQSVLRQVDASAFSILDTMNYWMEHTPDALAQTLRLVDCLIINDAEARQLSGEPNLIRAARLIRAMGPRTLVIKKGEHGALLFTENDVFSAPAYPLEDLHDPTGAGDAFMGGFAGYLAQAPDITPDVLRRAVVYGSATASFSVEAFGPERLFTLTAPELQRRVAAFHSLCAIPAEGVEAVGA